MPKYCSAPIGGGKPGLNEPCWDGIPDPARPCPVWPWVKAVMCESSFVKNAGRDVRRCRMNVQRNQTLSRRLASAQEGAVEEPSGQVEQLMNDAAWDALQRLIHQRMMELHRSYVYYAR